MSLEINYASRNVGDVFYTLRTDGVLNGAVPCDGATYHVEDFATLPDKSNIAYLLANGYVQNTSTADYEAQIRANGSCPFFCLDETTGTFRTPVIKDIWVQATNVNPDTPAKAYLAPQIPNLEGSFHLAIRRSSTVDDKLFKIDNWTTYHGDVDGDGNNSSQGFTFNASRYNSVYNANQKGVQPKSVKLRAMVQLVTSEGWDSGSGGDDGGGGYIPPSGDDDDAPSVITLQIPNIFIPGTEARATEVNENFDYVLRSIEKYGATGEYVTKTTQQSITGYKKFLSGLESSRIELKPSISAGHGGYIDFHFNGAEDDYTARIIESTRGYLALNQSPPGADYSTKIATTAWVRGHVSEMENQFNTMINTAQARIDSMIASFGSSVARFPNYAAGVNLANNTAAPSDGWLRCRSTIENYNTYIYVDGVVVTGIDRRWMKDWSGWNVYTIAPVSRGQVVTYTNADAIFYPCKGS